jgi:hypothetical protein
MVSFSQKLKLKIMLEEQHFVLVFDLVVGVELLRLCGKLLILSKSLNLVFR